MEIVFFIAALTSVFAVILICLFLFVNGIPAMAEIGIFKFLLGKEWAPTDTPPVFGILPMILGSLYITAGAILIGVSVGLFTAIFLARFCPRKIYQWFKPFIEVLAGVPSVVYGFFGLVVLVPFVRNVFGGSGSSIFTASLLLGVMILPTIIGVVESSIRAVPPQYYEGALALGATHERSVFFAELPAASSGVIAGVVLGIGRAIGETMAVILVAGNQARIPTGIFQGARTLTSGIVLEMGYAAELHRGALIATGVVLFVFILMINFTFSYFKRRAFS